MEEKIEGYFGIVEDPRSEVEKAQDFTHSDVFGTSPTWVKKDLKDCKSYTPREQDGSLSCCGQGSAKGVETLIGKVLSAHPPYRSRANYPAGGMYTQDIGAVWKKPGSTLEELDQSQNQGETLLNRDFTCATPYKIGGYVQPNPKSIDEIAQAITTYSHCMLIFHANGNEWHDKPVYNGLEVNFGHCICAVDYFLDENGVKCLLIEDSASRSTSINGLGQRIITEDYLKARCSGAIYFTGVNPLDMPYVFTKILSFGSRGFDVKKLQMKLGVQADGIFGSKTEDAVMKFQRQHNLGIDGIVGSATNKLLNSN